MGHTTLKISTQAELAALREFLQLSKEATGAIEGLQGAAGGGAGGHGAVHTGAPPPGPRSTPSRHTGAPPPVPEPAPVGERRRSGGRRSQETGAAPPTPLIFHPSMMQAAAARAAMPSQAAMDGAGGGSAPPAPTLRERGEQYLSGSWLGQGGQVRERAPSFLRNAASTAVGVGLGQGLMGFLLSSGTTWLELSKAIEHLGRRFRETGESAAFMGSRMGYTITQTAGMLEVMGGETNRTSRMGYLFRQGTGFARTVGVDPTEALRFQGRMGRLGAREVSTRDLLSVFGSARMQGMDEGRLGEHLSMLEGLAQEAFARTGRGDVSDAVRLTSAIGSGFERAGLGELGRGNALGGLLGRLNSTFTADGPMGVFMMRAMGYGGPGSDYIAMRKRMDAGIFGTEGRENLALFFKTLEERGYGREGMFKALEDASGGRLNATEIDALVSTLGTAEGRRLLTRPRALAEVGLSGLLESLPEGQREATRKAFMSALEGTLGDSSAFETEGRKHIALGEAVGVKREAMQLAVGREVAVSMANMQDSLMNIAGMLSDLLGANPLEAMSEFTGAVRDLSAWGRSMTKGQSTAVDRGSRIVTSTRQHGILGFLDQYTAEAAGAITGNPYQDYLWLEENRLDAAYRSRWQRQGGSE